MAGRRYDTAGTRGRGAAARAAAAAPVHGPCARTAVQQPPVQQPTAADAVVGPRVAAQAPQQQGYTPRADSAALLCRHPTEVSPRRPHQQQW